MTSHTGQPPALTELLGELALRIGSTAAFRGELPAKLVHRLGAEVAQLLGALVAPVHERAHGAAALEQEPRHAISGGALRARALTTAARRAGDQDRGWRHGVSSFVDARWAVKLACVTFKKQVRTTDMTAEPASL